jgi:hypothetical protein
MRSHFPAFGSATKWSCISIPASVASGATVTSKCKMIAAIISFCSIRARFLPKQARLALENGIYNSFISAKTFPEIHRSAFQLSGSGKAERVRYVVKHCIDTTVFKAVSCITNGWRGGAVQIQEHNTHRSPCHHGACFSANWLELEDEGEESR